MIKYRVMWRDFGRTWEAKIPIDIKVMIQEDIRSDIYQKEKILWQANGGVDFMCHTLWREYGSPQEMEIHTSSIF